MNFSAGLEWNHICFIFFVKLTEFNNTTYLKHEGVGVKGLTEEQRGGMPGGNEQYRVSRGESWRNTGFLARAHSQAGSNAHT